MSTSSTSVLLAAPSPGIRPSKIKAWEKSKEDRRQGRELRSLFHLQAVKHLASRPTSCDQDSGCVSGLQLHKKGLTHQHLLSKFHISCHPKQWAGFFKPQAPVGTDPWNLKLWGSHFHCSFIARGFPGSCPSLTLSLVLLPLFSTAGELEATGTHDVELLMLKLQFGATNHQFPLLHM